MTQHHLPTGCHDADSAAKLLNMSKKALLKRMRELGWLMVGGGKSNHNLPRREYIQRGYLTTHQRSYGLKGAPNIGKTYEVMLLTQEGLYALKHALNNAQHQPGTTTTATAMPHTKRATESPEAPHVYDQAAADAERKKALEQLREWGLAS